MNTNKNENKIDFGALLSTFSIKEISILFAQIDKSLISLHNCSSDDFLRLNNSFKEIYSQSKQISTNINDFINDSNVLVNNQLILGVDDLYKNLKAQFEILDYKIVVVTDQFEKLSNQIRHIFFPIKNFNQNLMSLNYLIANLKVSLSYQSISHSEIDLVCKQAEKQTHSLKLLSDEISNSLDSLSKIAKRSAGNLGRLRKNEDLNLGNLLTDIKSSIQLVANKQQENEILIPKINDELKESGASTTEIIKKLQYHDIIRQKMEHIQQTHKNLINELVQFNATDLNGNKTNEKIKCFIRIRDISGLQAAQLIHANKEYQSAIEVIINNFIQIGDNIKSVTEKCNKIYSFGNLNYASMYDNISLYINKANNYIQNLKTHNSFLDDEIELIHKHFNQTENFINQFKNQVGILTDVLLNLKQMLDDSSKEDSSRDNLKIQFSQLLDEISITKKKMIDLFDYMFFLKNNIEGFANKTDKGLFKQTDFVEFKDILQQLKISGHEINLKLEQNDTISKKVIKNIKNSISKIKYYEYFENIIQEIITELNNINLKLKTNDNQEFSMEKNLEDLKRYYTMQTEYIIHDKIVKGESIEIDIIDYDDDDDVEFF